MKIEKEKFLLGFRKCPFRTNEISFEFLTRKMRVVLRKEEFRAFYSFEVPTEGETEGGLYFSVEASSFEKALESTEEEGVEVNLFRGIPLLSLKTSTSEHRFRIHFERNPPQFPEIGSCRYEAILEMLPGLNNFLRKQSSSHDTIILSFSGSRMTIFSGKGKSNFLKKEVTISPSRGFEEALFEAEYPSRVIMKFLSQSERQCVRLTISQRGDIHLRDESHFVLATGRV